MAKMHKTKFTTDQNQNLYEYHKQCRHFASNKVRYVFEPEKRQTTLTDNSFSPVLKYKKADFLDELPAMKSYESSPFSDNLWK